MRRAAAAWGLAALWAAAIFWASAQPTVSLPSVPGGDKLAHFAVYALLGLLLARAAAVHALSARWAVLLGALYGASDEIHQHFVPGRSVELADWIADLLGVVAGVLLYLYAQSVRRGRDLSSGPLAES